METGPREALSIKYGGGLPRCRAGALAMLLALVFVSGCISGTAAPGSPKNGPAKTAIPDVARLVCGEDGSRLSAPKVRPRADGIHLVVENRLGVDSGFAVENREGGMGSNAPRGKSGHVLTLPPGELRVGCNYPPDKLNESEPDYQDLKVVDPEEVYIPVALECRVAGSAQPDYLPDARGKKGNVVELAREEAQIKDNLKPGDEVERAGYPESREPVVRVVRDGKVTAVAAFRKAEKGRWLVDQISFCQSF
jgi:hypothetical protein